MIFIVFLAPASALFPDLKSKDYAENDPVSLSPERLYSSTTQLPYDYFYLNFCSEIPEIYFGSEKSCTFLCETHNTGKHSENFRWMIDNNYKVYWTLDNLPSGTRKSKFYMSIRAFRTNFYQEGFPIGYEENGTYYIYNHFSFIVKYQKIAEDTFRIVGFLIEPLSLSQNITSLMCFSQKFESYYKFTSLLEEKNLSLEDPSFLDGSPIDLPPQELSKSTTFTFSVIFEESDINWSCRWKNYLHTSKYSKIHWFAILNSFGIILLLSGMLAHTLERAIRGEIAIGELETYNSWKQLSGDVFRAPSYSNLFSSVVSAGLQILLMSLITMMVLSMGFFTSEYRKDVFVAMMGIFILVGVLSGYFSGRLYRYFGGERPIFNGILTTVLFPCLCVSVFLLLSIVNWLEESSGHITFGTFAYVFAVWAGIGFPLSMFGHAFGFKSRVIQVPCPVNAIPRPRTAFTHPKTFVAISFIAGSLPFLCIFVEISYIMKTVWQQNAFYYLFGFLVLCFVVLVITSAEVAVLMTYTFLSKGDHRWWWLSVAVPGSSSLHFFFFSIVYYLSELSFNRFSSYLVYYGYMLLLSIAFGLINGAIGFLSTFCFVRKIYSLIKVD